MMIKMRIFNKKILWMIIKTNMKMEKMNNSLMKIIKMKIKDNMKMKMKMKKTNNNTNIKFIIKDINKPNKYPIHTQDLKYLPYSKIKMSIINQYTIYNKSKIIY